jgi:hypothetical protein
MWHQKHPSNMHISADDNTETKERDEGYRKKDNASFQIIFARIQLVKKTFRIPCLTRLEILQHSKQFDESYCDY